MRFTFESIQRKKPFQGVSDELFNSWQWQFQNALKSQEDYETCFSLSPAEKRSFQQMQSLFQIRTTPYYAGLAHSDMVEDPIRQILMPSQLELTKGAQSMLDPLGEIKNQPVERVIHRYSDRVLFLVTDICSVYCRFCTRKRFTGKDHASLNSSEYQKALEYIQTHKGIREVILSGGDPLTLSDQKLKQILSDLRSIEHIEIIRIGTRMPVVCPMRITPELVQILREASPVYVMNHFNHPRELTKEAADALKLMADHGLVLMNQMVLLNGVNNHAAIVQALSRRLLYLRVKPYYMFQCDPSEGTDHLRTSIEDSLEIQRELWGHLSGLAMPNYSIDIPHGGGKAYMTPQFQTKQQENIRSFEGWDGIVADYVSPTADQIKKPMDVSDYQDEWRQLKNAKDPVL